MKQLFPLLLFLCACGTGPATEQKLATIEDSAKALPAGPVPEFTNANTTLIEESPGAAAEVDEWPETSWQDVPPPSYQQGKLIASVDWQQVQQGVDYALIPAPMICNIADSKIDVLRIDPKAVDIRLLSADFEGGQKQTAEDWGEKHQLLAMVNAGMFDLSNGMTCTGMMRDYDQVNNPNLTGTYNLVAAFNPKDPSDPAFRFIDLRCEDWNLWKDRYHSYVQGIRIVDCNRKNRWSRQEKFWSMVLLGRDSKGNVLFIFSRSPYRVHDLSNMLLQLPIDLQQLMYLEGGPEASFWLNSPALKVGKMGSYETDFMLTDDNQDFWGIPNIIAVKAKS